jgi:hypothetical protein
MKNNFADGLAIRMAQGLIETVKAYGAGLEPWEREHIDGYIARLADGKPLSPQQSKTLRGIHMRRVKSRSTDAAG